MIVIKKKEVTNKINKTLQVTIYTTFPMTVGLSILAAPVWNVFYGESLYGPKVFVLSIFVAIFGSIFTNVVVIMQSLSRYKIMYIALVLGFSFNAITNIPFMVFFNKIGLPMYYGNLVATMIGYSITIFMCLIDLKKTFNISYFRTFKDLILVTLSCIIMTIVLLLLKNIIVIDGLTRLMSAFVIVIYALIGGLIYFVITYKLGLFNRILGFKLKRK